MELPKISKKAIIIGATLLAVGGAGLLLYLNSRDSYDGTAWVDSNWMYRRTISVANSGDTLTNEDVLVTIDTASLISNNKLQSNCEDLRFTDSDDGSYLDYWIEDDCNTTNTKIWVRIPSLPSGGKNIYVYYGNSLASAGSLPWNGDIYMYADGSCPEGWTQASGMNDKFLYGSDTFGSTGGSDTHTHSNASCTSNTSTGTTGVCSSSGDVLGSGAEHTHTLNTGFSNSSNVPPYKGMVLCYRKKFTFSAGLISVFGGSTPNGYTRFTGLDDYFPRVMSSYGATGGDSTHTHTGVSANSSIGSGTQGIIDPLPTGGTITTVGNDRVHTFTSSGTFTTHSGLTVEALVVAGGGGGGGGGRNYDGGAGGGGGGAGGVLYNGSLAIDAESYTVTVGNGGAGNSNEGAGGSGENSSFASLTAIGGGGGAGNNAQSTSGGSGGGGCGLKTGRASGTSGQGNNGGSGVRDRGSGGGGGAGGAGANAVNTTYDWAGKSGGGGVGQSYSITGTAVYYGGGGGGGNRHNNYNYTNHYAQGGMGGGGDGGYGGGDRMAKSGVANTGGGGGGGGASFDTSVRLAGSGGSGIVIIRYTAASSTTVASATHTHSSLADSISTTSNIPPYKETVFGKVDSEIYVNSDNILITSEMPPLGYNRFSDLDGKFLKGSSIYGDEGGSSTHSHNVNITTTSVLGEVWGSTGSGVFLSDVSHTHSCSTTSSSVSNLPSYYSVIYTKRKESNLATIGDEITEDKPPHTPTSWVNHNWLYRSIINVENDTGSEITNEDVLIVVDTASLISSGKLQSNCADFRFTDTTDGSFLHYWIEGNCNTSNTSIWVRIPSLPSGGKNIYMYYGNPIAESASLSWSGKVLLYSTSSCPPGWTRETAFDNRFAYGGTTYGATGGASSHDHGGNLSVRTPSNSGAGNVPGGDEYTCGCHFSHQHDITGTISNETSLPPYMTTFVCSANVLSDLTNLIFLSDTSIPSGWNRETAFDGKIPYGFDSAGTSGGATSHTHTFTDLVTSPAPNDYCVGMSGAANTRDVARGGHTHSVTLSSNGAGSNYPPYKTLLFVTNPSYFLNTSVISMFSVLPPLGWTRYAELDNFFTLGGSAVNLTAQGSATHSHALSFSMPRTGLGNRFGAGVGLGFAPIEHTHTASYNLSGSSIPPYITVIYGKRKDSKSTTFGNEEIGNEAPNTPSSLLTDSLTNPTGVTTPKFSAIFTDSNSNDKSTHYQIEVNTNTSFTGTVMWDSGKVAFATPVDNGSRTPDITYAGTTLQFGVTYYWRIKLWDNAETSLESPWSETAQFTTNYRPNQPSTPLTNGLVSPTKVSLVPTFSALYIDSDENDEGASYQIKVADNATLSEPLAWDSGKTTFSTPVANNTRSPEIAYSGDPLSEGTTYYWQMRIWDNKDTESEYSTTSQFKTLSSPSSPTGLWTNGSSTPGILPSRVLTFSAIYSDGDGDSAG